MILRGRRKLLTSYSPQDMHDFVNVVGCLQGVIDTHNINKSEIDYLVNYRNGRQPIIDKQKLIRPEINNKLVINHAQMITRTITGYFLGTPIQYVQASADKKEQIEMLNQVVAYEDKASVDKEIAEYQSICGTAYRIIFTDGVYGDEVPFEDRLLNPSTTFVVYENTIAERPVMGVTYFASTNYLGQSVITYYIYTEFGLYECMVKDGSYPDVNDQFVFTPYSVGGIPIIEYPNNLWRIGDWELCIDVMNALNDLESGRLDDIDQVVQSLLVFINADVDENSYEAMRQAGIISLKNTTNNQTDIKNIVNNLDQNGMNSFSKELEEFIYALIGIPDRNNRAGGGGDTGQAVELRDGWADLEIVARNKELTFKRSEKMALKIMLNILNAKSGTNLSLLDINIKFSRNKNNNLLVKTQAYMNLIGTQTLDPADCLTIVDLVSDVNDFIERGKSFWGDNFAGQQPSEPVTEPPTEPTNEVK